MAKRKIIRDDMPTDDQIIVRQAHKRYDRCVAFESEFRRLFALDIKFANGDPDNKWQWPDDIQKDRNLANRPMLTINKTRQHNLQIINDAKQNKPGIKISPVGDKATYEAAKIYMGLARHVEYKSGAEQLYDQATKFQVEGGIGYFRVVTDYVNDDTFDQEILIKGINDPMTVYIDPDIQEIDGSDAKYGFIFSDVPRDEFDEEYEEYKAQVGQSTLGNTATHWITKDYVRVAEYYRKVRVDDKLVWMTDPKNGQKKTVRASKIPKRLLSLVMADPSTKSREIIGYKVEWYKIAGDTIIDRRDWPGKYIPICRVVGEETKIDGRIDRKGHTRSMKDVQRMYNFWSSAGVEYIALQGKYPWVAPAAAIAGYQNFWDTSNTTNYAWLPWNHEDEDGKAIPAPFRANPPVAAQAYVQGMQIAQNEMMMVTGQYQAQFGENENAKSGIAINARQRQGERATYHYIDGLGIGIKFLGKIFIDLAPKIYDTERVIQIMAENGDESEVTIKPDSEQAFVEQKSNDREGKATIIFNPKVGEYAVQADVGPSFATKRQEAFNAFTQLASQSDNFMSIAGDIMFKAADFPMADELAERYRRMVPLQALGEAPPPEVTAMIEQGKEQVKNLQAVVTEMAQQLSEKEMALSKKDTDAAIRMYGARTQRLGVVANAMPELGEAVLPVAVKTEQEILAEGGTASMGGTVEQNGGGVEMLVPMMISALRGIAEGQGRLFQAVTAPRVKTLIKDPQTGKPTGSRETIDMGNG